MSLEVELSFSVDEHEEQWDKIGQLLQQGIAGARQQDAFDGFGEVAADKLEVLLESYPPVLLHALGYHRANGQVSMVFEWPPGQMTFALALKDLLAASGAKAISFRTMDLAGD